MSFGGMLTGGSSKKEEPKKETTTVQQEVKTDKLANNTKDLSNDFSK
jgi:NADH:ubiquinone oxidoreductase, E subunit